VKLTIVPRNQVITSTSTQLHCKHRNNKVAVSFATLSRKNYYVTISINGANCSAYTQECQYTLTHKHTYTKTRTHTHTYTHTYTYTRVYIHTQIHAHTHTHLHTHAHNTQLGIQCQCNSHVFQTMSYLRSDVLSRAGCSDFKVCSLSESVFFLKLNFRSGTGLLRLHCCLQTEKTSLRSDDRKKPQIPILDRSFSSTKTSDLRQVFSVCKNASYRAMDPPWRAVTLVPYPPPPCA